MKRPAVFVVFRDLPPLKVRMPPWWSLGHQVQVAHRITSRPMASVYRSYVDIVDEGRSTADLRFTPHAQGPAVDVVAPATTRWDGTHCSAISTALTAAGWIAGREIGADF